MILSEIKNYFKQQPLEERRVLIPLHLTHGVIPGLTRPIAVTAASLFSLHFSTVFCSKPVDDLGFSMIIRSEQKAGSLLFNIQQNRLVNATKAGMGQQIQKCFRGFFCF